MLLAPIDKNQFERGFASPGDLEADMGARSRGRYTLLPRPRHDAQASLCVPIAAHHAPVPSAALPPAHTTKGITSNTMLESE